MRRRRLKGAEPLTSQTQRSGMGGVYLVAAELVSRGFIVSVTSRQAAGADLLVPDDRCARAWSVQVKATIKPTVRTRGPCPYWLLSRNARVLSSPTHMYVFIMVRRNRTDYYVVPSKVVARNVRISRWPKSTWYRWDTDDTSMMPGIGSAHSLRASR